MMPLYQDNGDGAIHINVEFLACLIEAFEDFLEDKGIEIENPEKAEAIAEGKDPESICNIYGTDFGNLEQTLESIILSWTKDAPEDEREGV